MADSHLLTVETPATAHDRFGWDRYEDITGDSSSAVAPTSFENTKDLYLDIARWASEDNIQTNWIRIVREDIARAELPSTIRVFYEFAPDRAPRTVKDSLQQPSGLELDVESVAHFVTSGGRESVQKIWSKLQTSLPEHSLISLARAIAEVVASNSLHLKEQYGVSAVAHVESFLERAKRLDSKNQTDTALDLIYDRVDEMMRKGELEELDCLLADIEPNKLSTDLLLGILTATLPVRQQLKCRSQFFTTVRRVIEERGDFEEGLLTGLES